MKYFLIGERLSHSFSPQIHALLGNDNYSTKELPKDKLGEFMKKRDFAGINVTIPYKKTVMPFCDFISDEAKKIGCVNTVVNRGGLLYGYNTDYFGFSYMCKAEGISFAGKKVVILGGGGTSLTAATVAADCGASEIVTISRQGENNYESIDKHCDCDIIINTTPVGMYPNCGEKPVELAGFKKLTGVVDVIYNPLRTRLLQDARQAKVTHVGGLSMLVAQAFFANEHFFGVKLDELIIMKVKNIIEQSVRNIVLIGMPGCGKTTTGKLIAKRLGLSFVDTDKMIQKTAGMTVSEIFKKYGEPHFRKLEEDAIKTVCKTKMQVIATGGGSIISAENRATLMADGFIIWLDRNVSDLATKDRPLSQGDNSLQKLYEQRLPIYSKLCDLRVDGGRFPQQIAKTIEKYFLEK